MDESLMERRRVIDEVLRHVKIFYGGGSWLLDTGYWKLEIQRAVELLVPSC